MTIILSIVLFLSIFILFVVISAFRDSNETNESPFILDKPTAYLNKDTEISSTILNETYTDNEKELKIVGSYINKEITIQKGYKGENSYRVYVSELGREQLCTLKHDTLYAMNDVGVINKSDFFYHRYPQKSN
ncbi:hypothetical protein ACQ1Q5_00320 [Ornithobacterium rhinotracheale]